jgi:type IV pilus assembly protein PilV
VTRRSVQGVVLVEVLVTATVIAIGVLGLVQVQGRTAVATVEAQQRTQALLLARDMAERLVANGRNAAGYVGADYGIAGAPCDPSSTAGRDRCAWNAALQGTHERLGSLLTGGLNGGRGCVAQVAARRYVVVVSWRGLVSTSEPRTDCGRDAGGSGRYRRALTVPVELPDLSAV